MTVRSRQLTSVAVNLYEATSSFIHTPLNQIVPYYRQMCVTAFDDALQRYDLVKPAHQYRVIAGQKDIPSSVARRVAVHCVNIAN